MKIGVMSDTHGSLPYLEKALDGAEIVLFVLPTKAVRIVAKNVRKVLDKSGATPLLVTATKGIEPGSK